MYDYPSKDMATKYMAGDGIMSTMGNGKQNVKRWEDQVWEKCNMETREAVI